MRFLFIFSIILFTTFNGMSQDKRIVDSLEKFVKTAPEDTIKARALGQIALFYSERQPDKALEYGEKALTLSEKLDFKIGVGIAYNHIGMAYRTKGEFAKSLEASEKSIRAYEQTHEKVSIASALSNMGTVYVDQGNYDKAYEKFLASLEVWTKLDDKERIAVQLANIGVMFQSKGGTTRSMRDYEEALKYHFKAYEMDKQLAEEINKKTNVKNDKRYDISIDLNNIGSVYIDISKIKPSDELLNKALIYFQDSYKLKEEVGDIYGKAIVLVNMCDIYIQKGNLSRNAENFTIAITYGKRSLALFGEVSDSYGTAHTYNKIAQAFGEKHLLRPNPILLDSSLFYFQTGMETAKEIDAKDLLKELYSGLSEVYELKGDYKKSLMYERLYSATKDSVLNAENTRTMNEMETKYQTAEKDKEITKQNAEIKVKESEAKQKATERNAFIIGFGLVLVLSIFIFRSYRQKRKANIIITEQKKEVEFQKLIIEEHNRDITDSIMYARRIQRSLLPPEKYIDKSLKRLMKD